MIQQHRLVYDALGDRMHAEIHALSMKTYTRRLGESARHTEWMHC